MRLKVRSFLLSVGPPLLVSAVVFALYLTNSTLRYASDFVWAPHITASLIYQREPYLNEFEPWFADWRSFALYADDAGKVHSTYPLAGQVLIMPQAYVLDALLPEFRNTTLHEYLLLHPPTDPAVLRFQLINASLLVAVSAGFMYLIGRHTLTMPYALLLTATYAFGTAAYSTASRAMWQHGPSMLMLSVTLWLLVMARRRPNLIPFASLPLAAAYVIRPTNSLSVAVITLYVLICYRRQAVRFLLLALLVAVPFVLSNFALYGAFLPPYFTGMAGSLSLATLGKGLLGTLLSPGRGLFIFSPVLLLMPAGIALKVRGRSLEPLDVAVALILLLHWLLIASFRHWWAGFAFGPRYFADVMPYAVFLLIPVLLAVQSGTQRRARVALGGLFGVLLALSVAIHTRGATSHATWTWNSVPVSAHEHTERIWDWSDLQFLRGLTKNLLTVTPEAGIFAATGDGEPQPFSLLLGNTTDDPIAITVRLPGRVALKKESTLAFDLDPLPAGGQVGRLRQPFIGPDPLRVELDVNTGNLAAGQSLGAIQFIATKTTRAGAIIEDTRIITLATDSAPEDAALRPADIHVVCREVAPGELTAQFGAGWYDAESAGEAHWRWAASPAFFFVHAGRRQTASVEWVASALHDPAASDGLGDEGVFRVTLPDGSATAVAAQAGQTARVEATLQPGWNTFVVALEAGNFRPADQTPGHFDSRDLSFSVEGITLAGACEELAAP